MLACAVVKFVFAYCGVYLDCFADGALPSDLG